ncbi:MAG: hypothetical protein QW484_01605 [Candidatus Pacearchaeota archaeon]
MKTKTLIGIISLILALICYIASYNLAIAGKILEAAIFFILAIVFALVSIYCWVRRSSLVRVKFL